MTLLCVKSKTFSASAPGEQRHPGLLGSWSRRCSRLLPSARLTSALRAHRAPHNRLFCFFVCFFFSGRLRLRVPLAEPRGGLGVPRGSRRPAGGGGGRAGRPPATDVTSARRQRDRAACRRDADTSLAFVFSPLPSSTSADLQPADSLCVCVRLVPPGSRCCASLSLKTAHCCTLLTGPTDLFLAPPPPNPLRHVQLFDVKHVGDLLQKYKVRRKKQVTTKIDKRVYNSEAFI